MLIEERTSQLERESKPASEHVRFLLLQYSKQGEGYPMHGNTKGHLITEILGTCKQIDRRETIGIAEG